MQPRSVDEMLDDLRRGLGPEDESALLAGDIARRNYDVEQPDYDSLGCLRGVVFALKMELAFVVLAFGSYWVMS
jgi:hypothetical protein